MKKKLCHYDKSIKVKAIEIVVNTGLPYTKVAALLGVSHNSICNWMKKYRGNKFTALKIKQSKV